MNEQKQMILSKVEDRVKERLKEEKTGHDWFHIERVTTTAKQIACQEKADIFIVQLAALVHDLIDEKVVKDEEAAKKELEKWFAELGVSQNDRQHVMEIIQTISFKGGNGPRLSSLEAKVVQDADRLDAIGAIGIARCFTYAGSKGHVIDDPSVPVRKQMTLAEYRNAPSTAINHFYEKLLKLKEQMNTQAGKEEAERRHLFMEQFLQEFYRETHSTD